MSIKLYTHIYWRFIGYLLDVLCPIPISSLSLSTAAIFTILMSEHNGIYILIYLILVVFCTVCTFAKMFVFRLSFWFLIYCAIRTVLATLLDFQISWINESRVSYHKLCCGIRFRPNFPQYCAVLIYVYNSTVLLFLTDFDDGREVCIFWDYNWSTRKASKNLRRK